MFSALSFLQGVFICTLCGGLDHRPSCQDLRGGGGVKAGSPRRVQGSLAQGQAGALTFRRPGRSLEGSRSAGSGSRPGCYGRSRPQSSCGCPAHTRPGLGGGEEGDDGGSPIQTTAAHAGGLGLRAARLSCKHTAPAPPTPPSPTVSIHIQQPRTLL